MRGRPKGWLGLGLAARSSRGAARVTARFARALGLLVAWSLRVAHMQDGAVARSPTAWWWLVGGKVLPARSWGPPGKEGAGGAH
jgi:hypothetical protein